MNIFNLNNNQLLHINEKYFKLEKEIQYLFEKNLSTITDYIFIKS